MYAVKEYLANGKFLGSTSYVEYKSAKKMFGRILSNESDNTVEIEEILYDEQGKVETKVLCRM